ESSGGLLARASLLRPADELIAQLPVCRVVRRLPRPYEHVGVRVARDQPGQHLRAQRLPDPPLHPVPLHDRTTVPGHHHSDPWMRHGGSRVEDVQMGRPAPFPPPHDLTDLRAARDATLTRQPSSLPLRAGRRRHTSPLTACDRRRRPDASGRASGGGSAPSAPPSSPSARENRACSSASDCAADTSAFPWLRSVNSRLLAKTVIVTAAVGGGQPCTAQGEGGCKGR